MFCGDTKAKVFKESHNCSREVTGMAFSELTLQQGNFGQCVRGVANLALDWAVKIGVHSGAVFWPLQDQPIPHRARVFGSPSSPPPAFKALLHQPPYKSGAGCAVRRMMGRL